jgi:hypothetical protein
MQFNTLSLDSDTGFRVEPSLFLSTCSSAGRPCCTSHVRKLDTTTVTKQSPELCDVQIQSAPARREPSALRPTAFAPAVTAADPHPIWRGAGPAAGLDLPYKTRSEPNPCLQQLVASHTLR